MTSLTFYARGDSSSANNGALNAENTNTTPTTTLEFQSGATGDVILDYAGGGFDPNTTVLVDGVERFFTVEFSGTLPQSNKLSNVNGEDLRGEEIVIITTDDGQRYFFLADGSATSATMDDFPNGAHSIENIDNTTDVLICFGRGTLIRTPDGDVPVEKMECGDWVLAADGCPMQVLWISSRKLSAEELQENTAHQPLCIPADSFGQGHPYADMCVSPQHRIGLAGYWAELLFGSSEVLTAAKHLSGLVRRNCCEDGVEYFHILLDRHAVLVANGLPAESFFPGDTAIQGLSAQSHRSIHDALQKVGKTSRSYGPTACRVLSSEEAELLLASSGANELSAMPCVPEPAFLRVA